MYFFFSVLPIIIIDFHPPFYNYVYKNKELTVILLLKLCDLESL